MNNRNQDRKNIFIMRDTKSAEYALGKWLGERQFNSYSSGWKDKKGNDGIGLIEEFGNLREPHIKKAGVIICLDNTSEKAREIVEAHLGYGEEDEAQSICNN